MLWDFLNRGGNLTRLDAGLFRQFSYFVSYHRKATTHSPARAASIAAVQGKQIGLFGNVLDSLGISGQWRKWTEITLTSSGSLH